MTRLARALKCGWRGARGLLPAIAAAARLGPRSEPRARPPRPTAHCSKNHRRVTSRGSWPRKRCDWQFIESGDSAGVEFALVNPRADRLGWGKIHTGILSLTG